MFGMPNLLNGLGRRTGITLLGRVVSGVWDALFPGAIWGVFNVDSSVRAVDVSSVAELDIVADSRVSDYIIQTGSFVSYNKVRNPDIISIRMTKDGGDTSRLDLLGWLEQNINDQSLFDVLTPERRHPSMTLVAYRIARSARSGAGMIIADCLFQQVRQKTALYSTTTIEEPEDFPTTPTARANPVPGEPNSAGGAIAWQ